MTKISLLLALCAATACAGGAQNRAEPPASSEARTPAPGPSAPATASTPPAPTATAARANSGPKPVPPLSSPNARATASDAGAAPSESANQTELNTGSHPLRRAAEAAQTCYAQAGLPQGAAGKLHLRITLDSDGNAERIDVDRASSTDKLLGGKLEQCVIAAFKKQKYPPPRSGSEVVLDVPLQFRPTQ